MGYVEENLMSGENVLHRTRLHPSIFYGPALLAVVFLLPIPVIALAARSPIAAVPSLVLAILFCLPLLSALVRYKTGEFAVTNRRIIIKVGFLSTRSLELDLRKVESMAVNRSLMDRMNGTRGTIVVCGTGGTKEAFKGIANALPFRQAVNSAISEAHV